MPTISGSPTNFNLTSTWTVVSGALFYMSPSPNTDSQSVTFDFSSIPAGTKIESAVLYATFGSPATGAALRTVNGTSFSGSRNVTITPGGSNTFIFRFKANGSASSPTGVKSSTLSVSNVRIVVNEGQTGGGTDPSNPSGSYQSPQYVWFDDTSNAKPGEMRTLKWTPGSAHIGRTVKGYDIHRGTVSGGGVTWFTSAGNATQFNVPAPSDNGSSYYYKVLTIQDDNTYYMYSNATGIVTAAWTDTAPPSNFKSSPLFPTPGQSFTLSWDSGNPGNNNAITGYQIQRAENADGPWTVLAANHSGTSMTTNAHPTHSGKYFYRGISLGTYSNGEASSALEVTSVAPATVGSLNNSSVAMDDASSITLSLTSPNATYNHKAIWGIGSKSWTDTLAVGVTSSTLVAPLLWCEEVPNSTSGIASVVLETYDGESKIGQSEYTFTVIVPSTVLPTISELSGVVVDGYTGLYLKGISKVQLAVTAQGTLGSTIPSNGYMISGGGETGNTNPWTSPILFSAGSNDVSVIVVDSRGRVATKTETVTVTDYSPPGVSAVSASRCLSDGTINNDGTYLKVKATLTVTSLSGNNPIASALVEYRKRGTVEWVLGTASIISNTDIVVGIGNIAISDAYEVRVSLTDTVGKTTLHTSIISPSSRLYDFRTDRAGIGRVAGDVTKQLLVPDNWTTNINAEKLGSFSAGNATGNIPINNGTVNTDLNADTLDGYHASDFLGSTAKSIDSEKLEGSTLAQVISACLLASHPIGSIYESVDSTPPSTLFGGTWSSLGGQFLIGADATYTAGSTGGAASVALTTAQMPSHTHKAKSPTSGTEGGVKTGFDTWRVSGDFSADYMLENTGGGQAHENMPPFLSVYRWKRTA